MGYIHAGQEEGATVAVGGGQLDSDGYFVQPTLFTDVKPDMKIAREEIFGPVGVVFKFKDEAEILALANDSTYGLSACIYTKDIDRATRMAHTLEAGSVYVRYFASNDELSNGASHRLIAPPYPIRESPWEDTNSPVSVGN